MTKELSRLFEGKTPDTSFTVIDGGDLLVPTGRLVVGDPFQCCAASPLTIKVTPGRHPVQLYLKDTEHWGKRIAFARLLFSGNAITTWIPAITEEGLDFHFVEAGLSSFMDEETAELFCDLVEDFEARNPEDNYYRYALAKEFRANAGQGRKIGEWDLHDPFHNNRNNISIFSSGTGDGQYKAYWGLSSEEPVMLVIDFNV